MAAFQQLAADDCGKAKQQAGDTDLVHLHR
jgi:hypothetical protein